MSIVKNIVDLMGGTISVNSRKNEGSEFIVKLSLDRQSQEDIQKETEANEAKSRAGTADFSSMRLLLADDMPINRHIAIKLLEKQGFTVETAENGKEAVDKVIAAPPGYYNAVLMDVQMPVMGGYEATRIIRELADEQRRKIPVIAMTANAFAEDVKKAKDAGMNAHIAKPIDVKNMIDILRDVLT